MLPHGSVVKNPPAMQKMQLQSLGQEDLLEEGMTTHSVLLSGKSHGQRSLAGNGPWGCKELDMTEATEQAGIYVCILCVCVCTYMYLDHLAVHL